MSGGEKRIKVFVDGHYFDKEFQGTQTFLREIYNVLLRDYSDLEIYFGATNVQHIKESFPLVKETNIIPYRRSQFGFMRYITDIPAIIKKYKIDFAHFQYIAPKPINTCSYIVTLHDILFEDFPSDFPWHYRIVRNILFKHSIRQAAVKTTVSAYSKERIAYHYHVNRKDLHVIPNGVNQSFGNLFQSKENARSFIKSKCGFEDFILYVSRIEPRKNHVMLLQSFLNLELYKTKLHLVLIGKESIAVPELTKLLANLDEPVKQYIHWYPQVSQEDLEAFYCACALFVFPSKAEGFGIPPLEAGLCKVPVLCSKATAMSEFTFFDPYTFDPNNRNEFQEKLQQIVHNPPDELFLKNVAAAIQKNYSWENSAATLYNAIQSIFNTIR